MEALFIGQTYIDVTFLADQMPTGDEKSVASEYAVSFGGNAVTAAFCCAKLGVKPDLISTIADDWLGRMFLDMAAKYDIHLHTPQGREIVAVLHHAERRQARDRALPRRSLPDAVPRLELDGCRALHLDGHQPDAALAYAERCRKAGILTSLDGGGMRTNTHELLAFIDVAMVAERFCEQMDKTPAAMLDYLKSRGCKIGGVTLGERGVLWYDESGEVRTLPALPVPQERVRDTSGAGDVFHGAYVYSYLASPFKGWEEHFRFAQQAAAYKIQHLGNEAGLPTLDAIKEVAREFDPIGGSNFGWRASTRTKSLAAMSRSR